MRYRALDSNGDYSFGIGPNEFLVNSPEAVAQAVQTRLLLWEGEWFLDQSVGTPYLTRILGKGTQQFYDQAIQERILGNTGVQDISTYTSNLDAVARKLTVSCTIDTIYGSTAFTQELLQ